jgi:hypothetical protein
MRFAGTVFLIAGIYGLLTLVPMYFAEPLIARFDPPALTHAEHFYGFVGTALAWQVLFLLISRDPQRLRVAMIPAVLEKLAFGVPAIVLYLQQRLSGSTLAFGLIDLVLGALFAMAYVKTAAQV